MWEPQLCAFPNNSIAPDLYPLGDSLEERATRLLDSLPSDPLLLVGASMGASCALEMARQEPDRISEMVLAGAKAGHDPELDLRDRLIAVLEREGISGIWTRFMMNIVGEHCQKDVLVRIQSIAEAQSTEDLVVGVNTFHNRPDLTKVVREWTKPLLVVCGTQGQLESEAKGARLSTLAPGAKLHVMRGCGHYMNMERPDEFNTVLRSFTAWVS